ncbi:MAG: BON domain-containing protein [Bacteroidetes bacterium]|nr:BON domain-containing protein [Bacteroidota bacterium]
MRAEVAPDTSALADSVAVFSTRASVAASVPALEQRERTVEDRLQEAIVATRVRRALANDRVLYRYAFAVEVVSGHAVVEGRVASEAEQERVVELAAAIKGVDYVVNEVQVD